MCITRRNGGRYADRRIYAADERAAHDSAVFVARAYDALSYDVTEL